MATKDGRAQIWYADGSGSVDGYTETIDDVVETIIGTFNKHFGTDIQIWTPETKTLQVGGTVPNWNAYEKIELEWQKIAIEVSPDVWIIGDFLNGIYRTWTNPGEKNSILVHPDGVVYDNGGVPAAAGIGYFNQFLSKKGLEATSVEDYYISMPIGTSVPGWDEYEKID